MTSPLVPSPFARRRAFLIRSQRPFAAGTGRLVLAMLLLCCALFARPGTAGAQEPDPQPAPVEPAALLDQARVEMVALRALEDKTLDDAATVDLRRRALEVQARAEEAASAFAPQLDEVKARLSQLGEPQAGMKESPDLAAQRAQLTRAVSTLDSQIKLARVLAVEAAQAADSASAERRLQFNARLGERTPSPLGPTFWNGFAKEGTRDWQRLVEFGNNAMPRLAGVSPGRWALLGVLALAMGAVHIALQWLLLRASATRVPPGRLRRSAHAWGVVAVWTLTPGLVAFALRLTLVSGPGPTPFLEQWLFTVEAMVWFGAFVGGLMTALLMPHKPSWRLAPVSNEAAARLWWFPAVLAVAVVAGGITSRLTTLLNASGSTLVLAQGLAALTFILVIGAALWSVRRRKTSAATPSQAPHDAHPAHETHATHEAADAPHRPRLPLSLSTVRFLAWAVLAGSALALVSGYVAFASFAMSQLVWSSILAGAAYLLSALVDDLCMTLIPRRAADAPADGEAARAGAEANLHMHEQAAVLLSGTLRVLIGFFALVLLVAPYGEGPADLFRRAGQINEGLAIGELSLQPIALARAALVLVVVLFATRLIKGWLANRLLPTSRMDDGMRMSVTTLFGYAGLIVAVALAMSAAGVGLERVAWVASALSVGIGFGLQAVVQNFVSGLILLAERPVKVGDWVSLSGVEGDIRRINVRATEIQMGDRSTVIVPNSEFITKIVRNVTYADSLGMVQFKLPLPLATDLERVREILLAAFANHAAVLPSPAPKVQLDSVDGANYVVSASGFVNSPRAAYSVKSDLLFEVLTKLRDAQLLPG